MLLQYAAKFLPQLQKPAQVLRRITPKCRECHLIITRSTNNALNVIMESIPDLPKSDLQQALVAYPDLAEVDEEHVTLWLSSAALVLKMTLGEVQVF